MTVLRQLFGFITSRKGTSLRGPVSLRAYVSERLSVSGAQRTQTPAASLIRVRYHGSWELFPSSFFSQHNALLPCTSEHRSVISQVHPLALRE